MSTASVRRASIVKEGLPPPPPSMLKRVRNTLKSIGKTRLRQSQGDDRSSVTSATSTASTYGTANEDDRSPVHLEDLQKEVEEETRLADSKTMGMEDARAYAIEKQERDQRLAERNEQANREAMGVEDDVAKLLRFLEEQERARLHKLRLEKLEELAHDAQDKVLQTLSKKTKDTISNLLLSFKQSLFVFLNSKNVIARVREQFELADGRASGLDNINIEFCVKSRIWRRLFKTIQYQREHNPGDSLLHPLIWKKLNVILINRGKTIPDGVSCSDLSVLTSSMAVSRSVSALDDAMKRRQKEEMDAHMSKFGAVHRLQKEHARQRQEVRTQRQRKVNELVSKIVNAMVGDFERDFVRNVNRWIEVNEDFLQHNGIVPAPDPFESMIRKLVRTSNYSSSHRRGGGGRGGRVYGRQYRYRNRRNSRGRRRFRGSASTFRSFRR